MKRKKRRQREIDFSLVQEIKENLKLSDIEMAEMLGLQCQITPEGVNKGSAQYYNYRKCGKVPADRYFAMTSALLLSIEEETNQKRNQILNLISPKKITS